MKAVILCGGKGTRLREETEFRPKPLVPVGGMPILWHIMKIYAHHGIREFVLLLGYKGSMIKEYFLNYEHVHRNFTIDFAGERSAVVHHDNKGYEDWKITFVETGEDTETGGRIKQAEPFVNGEDFCLTYGDGVADIDIRALIDFHQKQATALTCTGVHPESVFGILEVADGKAVSFREKPRTDSIVNGGFFVCSPKLFSYLPEGKECVFEQAPLRQLVSEGQLSVFDHQGFWYCMDTYKHVEDLNKRWKEGRAPWKIWA